MKRTPKPQVLEFMAKQLRKYIVGQRLQLTQWEHRRGMYVDMGKYSFDESFDEKITLGQSWISCYDCANFFCTTAVIPALLAGRELRLELDIGGEALVRVNGQAVGSVTTSGSWAERNTVFIGSFNEGDEVKIELEANVNSGDFCDAAMDGATQNTEVFKTAYIWEADEICEGYVMDIDLAFEALRFVDDEYIKGKIYAAADDSLHLVDYDFDEERVRKSIAAAAELFAARIEAIEYTAQSEVVFTSHSHIDVAWLWRIQESVRKSGRTFSNNISMMDYYPDMTFGQSQAVLYDMMKKHCPDIYERIKEKVKSRQWDICGNVWVEADTNIASGEALIRQLLYGTEFFRTEFGKVSKTYWLPDCFGFSWALPQIIRRSGMEYFITSKLNNNDTNRFPHTLFRWRGVNGDEVLAYLQRASYNGAFGVNDIANADKGNDEKEICPLTLAMFGYGDGGGGATYRMLERGKRLKNYPGLPKTSIGHVDEFFDRVNEHREDLPVWNNEMYYENHRGTYTSQAFVKKNNRKGEYLFTRGEMLGVFAGAECGFEYPKNEIEDGWKILLCNQFHDILPGSSIHEVYEDARRDYAVMNGIGKGVFDSALAALNGKVSARGESAVVWNLLAFEHSAPVTLEVPGNGYAATDSNGSLLPSCTVERDGRFYLTFTPDVLPSMGFKVFGLVAGQQGGAEVKAEKNLLENSRLRVELDKNGIITSIYDKTAGREVLCGKGNLLTVSLDKCVHETAWNLEINYQKKTWELLEAEKIEVVEQNAQRGAVRSVRRFNKSVITQDIVLNADSDCLVFETTVDWHETDKVLKAAFEVDVLATQAWYDIAHGAISRPTHSNTSYDAAQFEVAAHKWADISEGGYGVSLMNDCKYGYDIKDNRMRITLMRAPTCPDRTGDHGVNTFVYALYPHSGNWQQAETVKRALALNVPAVAAFSGKREGVLGEEKSFLSVDAGNVQVEAIKRAQDGRGIVLRVVETEQRRGRVNIGWALGGTAAVECNLMEEDEAQACFDGKTLSFDIKPFEVKTFRVF